MSHTHYERSQKYRPFHRDRSPSTDSGYSSRSGSYPPTPTTAHAHRSRRHNSYDDDDDHHHHRRSRTTYDTLAKTSVLVGVLSVLAGALQIWTTRQAVKRDCARDREEWERIRRRGGGGNGGRGGRRTGRGDAERGGNRGDDGPREQEEKWVRRQRIEGVDEETRAVRRMIEAPRDGGSYGDGETVVSEREQRKRARRRESSRSRP